MTGYLIAFLLSLVVLYDYITARKLKETTDCRFGSLKFSWQSYAMSWRRLFFEEKEKRKNLVGRLEQLKNDLSIAKHNSDYWKRQWEETDAHRVALFARADALEREWKEYVENTPRYKWPIYSAIAVRIFLGRYHDQDLYYYPNQYNGVHEEEGICLIGGGACMSCLSIENCADITYLQNLIDSDVFCFTKDYFYVYREAFHRAEAKGLIKSLPVTENA